MTRTYPERVRDHARRELARELRRQLRCWSMPSEDRAIIKDIIKGAMRATRGKR